MKNIVKMCAVLVVSVLALPTQSASAYTLQKEHRGNPTYDCSVTKKPEAPRWVWYRYPSKNHKKRDAYNNGKVHLIWEDSDRAHEVDIVLWSGSHKKKLRTADDAEVIVKNLKNNRVYKVKVRGVSNCGKSDWSKVAEVKP